MKRLLATLLVGLVLLIAPVVLAGGCGHKTQKTEIEPLHEKALESPFVEIIPTGQNLYIDSLLGAYRTSERTIYFSDGSILHSRIIGNEGSFDVPDKSKALRSIVLAMRVYVYQNEGQAIERIHKEKESRFYKKVGDTEYYAKMLGLHPEEIAGYVCFWKEPHVQQVQGREVIFFRVGQYVGRYSVYMDDPPKLKDGYFMPPGLHDLLKSAVMQTTPQLRSLSRSN